MDQKTKVEQADQCDHQHKYFKQSLPLQLSQIINIRLNQPRQEERRYHSETLKQQAKAFDINKWQEMVDKDELYQMSLTGHLIKAIQLQDGNATLNNLINVTEPYLPFLRKQNGKNFTGMATRTVKGCLSAVVFKRNDESTWSVDDTKVEEFISQANKKLFQFFEKLKKNFPIYDNIKLDSNGRKTKKRIKIEQRRDDDQYNDRFQPYFNQKLDPQDNIKIENHYQNFDQNANLKINSEWHYSISDNIFKSLYCLRQGEKIDDQFLGNLIGFYNIKHILDRMSEQSITFINDPNCTLRFILKQSIVNTLGSSIINIKLKSTSNYIQTQCRSQKSYQQTKQYLYQKGFHKTDARTYQIEFVFECLEQPMTLKIYLLAVEIINNEFITQNINVFQQQTYHYKPVSLYKFHNFSI
ncbi:unnamed protein product [Paramecium primaurelia]|uniref:Uncharacterized protein n=1 Tax=Paramecium primaurelia TaxID=5886 RepID=A0A8S1KJU4_PARPR|nr:unnamed protein product [Paramecium primaurelia]